MVDITHTCQNEREVHNIARERKGKERKVRLIKKRRSRRERERTGSGLTARRRRRRFAFAPRPTARRRRRAVLQRFTHSLERGKIRELGTGAVRPANQLRERRDLRVHEAPRGVRLRVEVEHVAPKVLKPRYPGGRHLRLELVVVKVEARETHVRGRLDDRPRRDVQVRVHVHAVAAAVLPAHEDALAVLRVANEYRPLRRPDHDDASLAVVDRHAVAVVLGSFHTSECRGGVERRQLKLKGVEDGD